MYSKIIRHVGYQYPKSMAIYQKVDQKFRSSNVPIDEIVYRPIITF